MNKLRYIPRHRAIQRRNAARHGEQGFTLIEVLVVITIIGLIMGLVGPRVLKTLVACSEFARTMAHAR